MTFTPAEAEELLRPGCLGMRTFAHLGKIAFERMMPGAEYPMDSIDLLIADIRGQPDGEYQEALHAVQSLDRFVRDIITEHGGSVTKADA